MYTWVYRGILYKDILGYIRLFMGIEGYMSVYKVI